MKRFRRVAKAGRTLKGNPRFKTNKVKTPIKRTNKSLEQILIGLV